MSEHTNNGKPKVSALSKFSALSALIIIMIVTVVLASLYIYTNVIRSPEKVADIEDSANQLTRNFMGSPLLILDVFYIGVSLVFITFFLFVVFALNRRKKTGVRIIYVDPVSSEIIKEKDLLLNKSQSVTDTTEKSLLLDGEYKFRGAGGFGNKTFFGGYFADNEKSDKTDSDGDHG